MTMMKQVIVVLALVGLAFSAPQTRKVFHEHVEDFLDLIQEEVGDELEHLMRHYADYEEFQVSLDYMRTNNFKDLVYEMESLPEFVAVVDFLESKNIDIHYFIDKFNDILNTDWDKKLSRHSTSGRDFTSFIIDSIALFPKEKLAALYGQKVSDYEEFKAAIESFWTDEWDQIYGALWTSEVFETEANTLSANGIELGILLVELMAVFGQV